ncbi:haloacid dehalogenase type II [Brevibacterium daeguense]|uniref:Haloacid dehalogenase type II n=1 Tax=Brevibacterium daeguense TaxID=909936 RepID=A0ABP8EFY0_9MICO
MDRPEVIVFDVNETVSDMRPLGRAFTEAGVPGHLARTWFAGILRDGFAASAAGDNVGFAEIARDSLGRLLGENDPADPGAALERIMAVFTNLAVHPDIVPGVEALAELAEQVTLSNGPASVAEGLLGSAGIRHHFSRLLSVEDAPAWKPLRSAYEYAAVECGRDPSRMMLVAVHPWDIHGAQRAGMQTAWLNRDGAAYPGYFAAPDIQVPDLPSLADQLRSATT